jgi:hypothetical protein
MFAKDWRNSQLNINEKLCGRENQQGNGVVGMISNLPELRQHSYSGLSKVRCLDGN